MHDIRVHRTLLYMSTGPHQYSLHLCTRIFTTLLPCISVHILNLVNLFTLSLHNARLPHVHVHILTAAATVQAVTTLTPSLEQEFAFQLSCAACARPSQRHSKRPDCMHSLGLHSEERGEATKHVLPIKDVTSTSQRPHKESTHTHTHINAHTVLG